VPTTSRQTSATRTDTTSRFATSPGFTNKVCARSESERRHPGLVDPPSRILRGVALHRRRMPVVLLNSRIVGDPEVGQKPPSRKFGRSWAQKLRSALIGGYSAQYAKFKPRCGTILARPNGTGGRHETLRRCNRVDARERTSKMRVQSALNFLDFDPKNGDPISIRISSLTNEYQQDISPTGSIFCGPVTDSKALSPNQYHLSPLNVIFYR
jgi:hypothetical protein